MMPRHFLATDQWADEEVLGLLARAAQLKAGHRRAPRALEGKVLANLFFDPSLRTRASFEVAMLRHGGATVVLEPGKGVWSFETRPGVVMDGAKAEHLVDAARVLGRYGDLIGVRAFPRAETWEQARRDEVLRIIAESAGAGVINLESARRHPCQGLADALTIREQLGSPAGKRFVLAWCWHPRALPTAVPVSAALAAARWGMEVVIARPEGFDLDPEDMEAITAVARRRGGSVRVASDLEQSVEGAEIVYAKSWGSLGHYGDAEAEAKLRAGLRGWRIDEELMARTREGRGRFMHCLPLRRNVIATDGVLDGPWSVVTDQAENRLHVQRALLLRLLGEDHE